MLPWGRSLAVNGYFKAEPLVGKASGKDTVIVEGNRRLAACLILAGDPRATNQARKATQYRSLWEKHGRPTLDPVPVITFDGKNDAELLSYLGVRHISASTPWDSYAKANWAAKVVATTTLTVTDISIMIGDPHRTVARLLEGYYVIQQAKANASFDPQDSVRKGRGSVTEYPFSWVYTILGYTAARKYLEMPEVPPGPNPLPPTSLPKVKVMLTAMFGSSSKGWNSVIQDSRELGDLAAALIDPDKLRLIEKGISLTEANRVTRPISERLLDNLGEVRRLQSEIVVVLAEEKISEAVAKSCHSPASSNRRTASQIEKSLPQSKALYSDGVDQGSQNANGRFIVFRLRGLRRGFESGGIQRLDGQRRAHVCPRRLSSQFRRNRFHSRRRHTNSELPDR